MLLTGQGFPIDMGARWDLVDCFGFNPVSGYDQFLCFWADSKYIEEFLQCVVEPLKRAETTLEQSKSVDHLLRKNLPKS